MEVARTSIIHPVAPHFLWPFASVFQVWGTLFLVRDAKASKLSSRTLSVRAATGGADSGGHASPSGGGAVGDPAGGPGAGQPPQPDVLETLSPQAIRAWIVRRGSPGGEGYGPGGAGAASPGGTAGAGGTRGTAGGAGGAAGAGGTAGAGGAGATSPRGATGAGGAGPTSRGGTAGAGGARGAAGAGGAGGGGTGGAGAAGPGVPRTGGAGAAGAGGAVSAGGAGGIGDVGTGGASATGAGAVGAAGPRGARTRGAGAAGAGGAAGVGGATGVAGTGCAGGTASARGAGAAGARGAAGAGGATGAAGAGGAGDACAGGARAADQSQPQLLPGSPLPAPAPHTEVTESMIEHREPETRASTTVRARRVTRPRALAIPCTHVSPSVGGEPALSSDVLEDRQFELECVAATLPCLASMLRCPEGDPDALDIPTPRSYAEAIASEYSSEWHTAMDAEMASWKSTGTYVDEVPPPGVNIVDGMWIFLVKRPPGSPRAFKARYVARGFSQRQGSTSSRPSPPPRRRLPFGAVLLCSWVNMEAEGSAPAGPSGSGGVRGAGEAGRGVVGGSSPIASVSTPAKDDVKAFNLEKFSGEDWCGPKAWKILKDVHAPSSETMVVVLERKLYAVKINEGDAVQRAFDQLRDLYVKLSAAAVDYPKKIKCYKALSLLPESWGPLVVNLNGMKDSWSVEWIRAQVLQEEFRRKELTAAAGEGGGSAYGMKGFKGRGSKKGKAKEGSGGEQYSGGKRGNKEGKRCGGKCWYCHLEGHPWLKCRKLPDGWRPGQPSIEGSKGVHGAMGEGMGSEEGNGGAGGHGGMFYHVGEACSKDMVVPASKVALHRSSHWVIDTGAFMTMTNREDLLDEVRPSKAATGQVVPVRGEGRAMFMGADGRLVGLKRVFLVPGLCANLLSTKELSETGMKMEMMGTKLFKATLDGRVSWDL
ncbi:unnamed protein product [Closterium sp. NIES-54]